ncbi:unnamed protein product, partial [Sphenostylis stenocarpa]
ALRLRRQERVVGGNPSEGTPPLIWEIFRSRPMRHRRRGSGLVQSVEWRCGGSDGGLGTLIRQRFSSLEGGSPLICRESGSAEYPDSPVSNCRVFFA